MKKLAVVLIVVMLILSLVFLNWSGLIKFSPTWAYSPQFPHLKSLQLNRQGNQQLKAQNYASAFDLYVKTLEFDPFSSETHLDLGLTYEGQQQPEKAMPSYQNAEKYAKNDELKFMSYFNQGHLLGKDKKVDEALERYQKALDIDPTSKETKHNIELLIQMQQQEQKGGGGDNKDQKDQKQDQKDNKDKKDQNKDQNKDKKDQNQDQNKDQKDDGDKDKKDKEQPKQYKGNQKYQPRPFKGQELSEGDVKKILGEIKQQEQKIRSEYNRKEVKEQPRDKDW